MFIYEKNGKLNVMIASNKPAADGSNADLVIEPVEGDPATVKILVNGKEYLETVPAATSTVVGGIKADAATETDTVAAAIGEDGKLYVPTYPVAAAQADSTATTIEGFVTEFNTFLGKLRTAGILAPEA